jgi:hypothetical protein
MEIREHILALAKDGYSLKDVVDFVITDGGIIGVGLITLEEDLVATVQAHHRRST